jgi:hypothetical protein
MIKIAILFDYLKPRAFTVRKAVIANMKSPVSIEAPNSQLVTCKMAVSPVSPEVSELTTRKATKGLRFRRPTQLLSATQ